MMNEGNKMNGSDAYRPELQTAMVQAELAGDFDAAETFQMMIDEFDANEEN